MMVNILFCKVDMGNVGFKCCGKTKLSSFDESAGAIFIKCLCKLFFGIHDDGTVPCDWLSDRFSRDEQKRIEGWDFGVVMVQDYFFGGKLPSIFETTRLTFLSIVVGVGLGESAFVPTPRHTSSLSEVLTTSMMSVPC